MAGTPEERLADLGIELPPPPKPAAAYVPWRRIGATIFTAGQVPVEGGAVRYSGLVGAQLTTDQGAEAAELCARNVLSVAADAAGGLSGLRAVKLTVFVASAPGFTEQHVVANGASELIAKVLGDNGAHARSAVGMAALPLNAAVEVEGIFEVLDA